MSNADVCRPFATRGDGELKINRGVQYVRCTNQKVRNITDCVVASAQKVDWLPPYHIYGGGKTCPSPHGVLVTAGISNILTIVLTVLFNLQFWKSVMAWRIFRLENRTGPQNIGASHGVFSPRPAGSGVLMNAIPLSPMSPAEQIYYYKRPSEVSFFRRQLWSSKLTASRR
jgi:hypothetical protein